MLFCFVLFLVPVLQLFFLLRCMRLVRVGSRLLCCAGSAEGCRQPCPRALDCRLRSVLGGPFVSIIVCHSVSLALLLCILLCRPSSLCSLFHNIGGPQTVQQTDCLPNSFPSTCVVRKRLLVLIRHLALCWKACLRSLFRLHRSIAHNTLQSNQLSIQSFSFLHLSQRSQRGT